VNVAALAADPGFGGPVGFSDVGLALLLVAVALVVSRWRRVGLESDMTVATVRSFVQLLLVGYALDFVFGGHGGLTVVVLAVMIATATWTSGGRAAGVPGPGRSRRRRSAWPPPARWACCWRCGSSAGRPGS
jgi:hypothetical protein